MLFYLGTGWENALLVAMRYSSRALRQTIPWGTGLTHRPNDSTHCEAGHITVI